MDWLYFLGCLETTRGNGELLPGATFSDVTVISRTWLWKEIVSAFNDGAELSRVRAVSLIGSSSSKVSWSLIEAMGTAPGSGISKKCFID